MFTVRRVFPNSVSSVVHANERDAWQDFNAAIHAGTSAMILDEDGNSLDTFRLHCPSIRSRAYRQWRESLFAGINEAC